MKRNASIERAMNMDRWDPPYFVPPSMIPPLSVVRVKKLEPGQTDTKIGDMFRVGYYNPKDGPNCVRLVNAAAEYLYGWDQKAILENFEIVTRSDEQDMYGFNRDVLEPLP